MKTKIMFVDDDPMLLASTRRQLLKKLPDCELVFFERAADALEDIAASPAAIVFSDVRMPEMDGAEFLQRVCRKHPETIRFAWTGQSEVSQLDRVFEIANYVFSKPCPTEKLTAMISVVASYCREGRGMDQLSVNRNEKSNEDANPSLPKQGSQKLSVLDDLLSTFEDIFIVRPKPKTE